MKFLRILRNVLPLCLLMACLASCTQRDYDTGDGDLSYLRADMVQLRVSSDKLVHSAILDDGTDITLSGPINPTWVTRPDTLYRALLCYDSRTYKTISAARVLVPAIQPVGKVENPKYDPVKVQSSWTSGNGRYLNLRLDILTGDPEDEKAFHNLGLLSVSSAPLADGTPCRTIKLLHDRSSMPEYYTTTVYLTLDTQLLPEPLAPGEALRLIVNTYNGEKTIEARI